ncbi:MAG: 54S ribosomal protein L22, mitochondrial [Peltula sp. TS41687]|nr:MAG: 54S ribosomal protein L22, mitochondrial [Peltula sp. TS41687]
MNICRKPSSCSLYRLARPRTGPIGLWSVNSPSLSPLTRPGNVSTSRTLFGWGRKTRQRPMDMVESDNPVYEEYLKKKPPPPPAVVPGDLAGGSIFESEDAGTVSRPTKGAGPKRVRRDPSTMAAVVDPQPDVRKRWDRKMVIRDIRRRGRLSRTQKIKMTERESLSKSHMFKTSVKKLGPVARQIAGKTLEDAMVQLRFSKKKVAVDVKEHLEHARNEAVVRRGMGLGEANGTKGDPVQIETKEGKTRVVKDRTGIYIDQAWVGRGPYENEPEFRARGPITVVLKEEATRIRQHEEREQKRRNRKLWVQLPNRPIPTRAFRLGK